MIVLCLDGTVTSIVVYLIYVTTYILGQPTFELMGPTRYWKNTNLKSVSFMLGRYGIINFA